MQIRRPLEDTGEDRTSAPGTASEAERPFGYPHPTLPRRFRMPSLRRDDQLRLREAQNDASPRIVLGTTNYADQAMSLTRALRGRSVTADHVLYTTSGVLPFGYKPDHCID